MRCSSISSAEVTFCNDFSGSPFPLAFHLSHSECSSYSLIIFYIGSNGLSILSTFYTYILSHESDHSQPHVKPFLYLGICSCTSKRLRLPRRVTSCWRERPMPWRRNSNKSWSLCWKASRTWVRSASKHSSLLPKPNTLPDNSSNALLTQGQGHLGCKEGIDKTWQVGRKYCRCFNSKLKCQREQRGWG